MKRISTLALLMLVLTLLVTAVSANVISFENSQVNAIGDTATANLVLDEAPNGLAGYSIAVAASDPSVASITAAGFPAWATMKDNSALPASSCTLKAADLSEQVQAGATSIPLATLTLKGLKAGSSSFTVTVTRMSDDSGSKITPTISAGTFTVNVPEPTPTPTPTTTTTIEPTPTTTPVTAPVAEFSATPTSGTVPLAVQFTDLSTGDAISAWAWDFNNDGVVDSTETNPAYTYTAAGSYTVKLTVTNAGGSDSEEKSGYITVSDVVTPTPTTTTTIEPTPTTTQTPDHTVPVMSASVSGNSVIVNWQRIADSDFLGYKVVVSKNNANPAYPGDGYMFWITDRETTSATLGESDTYNGGDFGGHLVPGETYYFSVTALYDPYTPVAGNAVQLTFPGGVTPTPTTTIEPTPTTTQNPAPVAGFSATPTSGTAPLTVSFTDASTGTISDYAWDFNNDGTIDSTEKNPTHTFATAGTFTVKLTVSGTDGSDDETKTNYITVTPGTTPTPVPAPVAGFSGTPTSGYAPLTVQFTDESTGTYNAIYWDFNDDLSPDSMVKNPKYTYTTPGVYNVSMLVSGIGGIDYEQKFGYITVLEVPVPAPEAAFSADPVSGTAPLTVQFTDASTGSITSYAWDFDNDGVIDSTEKSPSHVYSTAGTYAVNLTVTGKGGSDSETKAGLITVTEPLAKPVANFTADPLSAVAPAVVKFTDTSSGKDITAWAWDFESDGSIDNTEQNPQHSFAKPGVYTVTLTVTNAAGSDTMTKTGYVTITQKPPVAQFSADPLSGIAPLKVSFTDASTDADSYAWDFDNDGIIDSTEKNPEHIYTKAGTYSVNLTVANSAATVSEVKTAYITATIAAPVAGFSANQTEGAAPLAVLFKDESTGESITAWAWDFESDGVVDSTEQNPEHVFTQPGIYNVSLTATNAGGSNTAVKEKFITAKLAAPVANFMANQTSGYAPLLVEFKDQSTGVVASYAWDFENDGVVDSTEQNPVFTYAAAGNYTVNLTVANAGGSNTAIKTEYINVKPVPAPVVEFSANLTAGYAPLAVQFTDESKGIGLISWSWDFNNDNLVDSTEQNPAHVFDAPGNYTVSLAVKGSGGTVTTKKTDYITVSVVVPAKPNAEFVATPTSGKAPLVVKFTDKSVGKNITAWAWDFNGDGVTDSVEQNPSYTYATKGSYNVSLTVTNAGGSDTQVRKNYIKVSQLEKPQADFKADKQSGKAPLTVKFTDKSKGDAITEWSWDFNNDGVIDSTEKNPTYTYAKAGTYAVKLVVTNAAGSDMEIKSDFITVKGDSTPSEKKPVAVIFADKTWGTPPMTVKFADQSLNNPTKRTWFFGDGTSSTEANPTHLYAQPGIYFARLYVENGAGTDQDYRFIFVLPKWLAIWAGGK